MRPASSLHSLVVAALALTAIAAAAGERREPVFDPIPDSVWQLLPPPGPAGGAVVLEDSVTLRAGRVERLYRVRIFSEAGRDAARLPPFRAEAADVSGRTVYRDGREVPFGQADMVSVRARAFGLGWIPITQLVPPGLSSDCIVEVRWTERASIAGWPLPESYGLLHQWVLGNRYPTLVSSVRIEKGFPWSFSFDGPPQLATRVEGRSLTIRDLPAVETVPFALETLRPAPRCTVFTLPKNLAKAARLGEEEFWQAAGRALAEERRDVRLGKRFGRFAAEILAGTPEDPVEKAVEIRNRLERRIVNIGALTWDEAEQGGFLKRLGWNPDFDDNLAAGAADGARFRQLYLHLLRAAGLSPKVGMVTNRDVVLFDRRLRTTFQFTGELVGVTGAADRTVWMDASLRFAHPLLLLPAHQGTQGLQVDLETGAAQPLNLPVQAAAFNLRHFEYDVSAGEEDWRFRLATRFEGYPLYWEVMEYVGRPPAERGKRLRQVLEDELRGLEVEQADVRVPAYGRVAWELGGRTERTRTVAPFPGMPRPLRLPDALPAERTQPILIPYGFVHAAVSRVRPPTGQRLVAPSSLQRQNTFGRVEWAMDDQDRGSPARVRLRIEMNGGAYRAEAYSQLREYLAWMEEALARTVALEPLP